MARWKRDDWLDGHYELFMDFDDSHAWIEAAKAVWSHPALSGVWTAREFDPEADKPLDGTDLLAVSELMSGHLYGVARLPNGRSVPCGCAISGSHNWLILFLPLAGLRHHAYDTGAFPWGDGGRPWIAELDNFLVEIARSVFASAPFNIAAIGFEMDTLRLIEEFRKDPTVNRPCGLVIHAEHGVQWLPPTAGGEG